MPTDEQRALWAAIRAHPDDDTPRLVYADWLQENGDEPRAEFIRTQCALVKLGTDRRKGRNQRPVLEARQKELLAAHREEWLVPFFHLFAESNRLVRPKWFNQGNPHNPFHRGFLHLNELTLEQALLLVRNSDSVEPVAAIYMIKGDCGSSDAPLIELARWAGSNRVYQLRCTGATDDAVTAIIDGHFRSLSHLELTNGSITDRGTTALARWPLAAQLRVLELSGNPITRDGANALVDSPHLTNVNWLYLLRTHIGAEGELRLRERFGWRVHVSTEVE